MAELRVDVRDGQEQIIVRHAQCVSSGHQWVPEN